MPGGPRTCPAPRARAGAGGRPPPRARRPRASPRTGTPRGSSTPRASTCRSRGTCSGPPPCILCRKPFTDLFPHRNSVQKNVRGPFWHAGPVRKPPNRGRMPHSQGSMKRDLGFCCKVSTSKMPKSTEGCQKLVFAAHGTTETCAPVDVPRATVTAPSARSASPARVLATDAVAPRLRWRTAQMFHVRHSRTSAEREGSATRPFPISERPRSPSSSSAAVAAVATAQPRQLIGSRRNRTAPAAHRQPSQPRSPFPAILPAESPNTR